MPGKAKQKEWLQAVWRLIAFGSISLAWEGQRQEIEYGVRGLLNGFPYFPIACLPGQSSFRRLTLGFGAREGTDYLLIRERESKRGRMRDWLSKIWGKKTFFAEKIHFINLVHIQILIGLDVQMTDAALVGTMSIWVLIFSPGAQGSERKDRFEVKYWSRRPRSCYSHSWTMLGAIYLIWAWHTSLSSLVWQPWCHVSISQPGLSCSH